MDHACQWRVLGVWETRGNNVRSIEPSVKHAFAAGGTRAIQVRATRDVRSVRVCVPRATRSTLRGPLGHWATGPRPTRAVRLAVRRSFAVYALKTNDCTVFAQVRVVASSQIREFALWHAARLLVRRRDGSGERRVWRASLRASGGRSRVSRIRLSDWTGAVRCYFQATNAASLDCLGHAFVGHVSRILNAARPEQAATNVW